MEPVNFHMPGYRINEYLLVLTPPEDLWQKIGKTKEEFAEKYKVPSAKYLKPHIALVNFLTLDMMEEKIMQRLQSIAMGVAPFKIELKDYGSYPSHTIFVNVISKLPIQHIIKQFMEEPHIGIARKLKPWQYEQGWLEYSHRQFTGRFISDHMLLLKRRAGDKAAFQIAKRFEFQNLPVVTKQGSLFM